MSNLDMTLMSESFLLTNTPVTSLTLDLVNNHAQMNYPSDEIVPAPTPPSPPSTVVYYRIRGFYVAGGVYESWISTNPDSSPPSGHTLTNITQIVLNGT